MAAAAVMNMASSLAETRSTASSASVSSAPLRPIHQKMAKLVPFLRKVQQLCENAPSHIARWSADGKQFDVLDPKGFDELLKVHFEGASPATFHRQLFFYGWVKLNHTNGGGDEKTKGTWSFRHPCFLRDEPHKIYEIKRYARASDREEEDGGSRVDILEKRVSALQSLVDDLSRKLAAVQLTLDRSQPQQQQQAEQQPFEPARTTKVEKTRKRVKDDDLEFLADEIRLTEEDLMHLFDDEPALVEAESEPLPAEVIPVSPMVRAQIPAEAEQAPAPMKDKMFTAQQQQKAQELLTSFMATPQFQAALTSKTIQEGSQTVRKVEVPPHLSVC